MSETAPEAVVETAEPTTTEPAATPESTDLGDAGKKALAAERTARKAAEKNAAELAAKVQAFEDASKSETEKAAARAEAAERRAVEAEAKAMRAEVADDLEVPKHLRQFLTASDDAALREQAATLLTAFNTALAEAGPRQPKPDPSQGAKPGTPNDLDRQIAEAETKGDIPRLIALKRQRAYTPTI